MNRKEMIMKRLKEHYDFIVSKGYEVVCLCLQGSQNYELDEYTDEHMSDIDSKAIVLPSVDDFVCNKQPVSKVLILENEEHAEVKDIRVMFEMFKKANLSYIELLYTDFRIINPKYADLVQPLFDNRDKIAEMNKNQFLRCLCGMAYEKQKALCHPYPATAAKIEKYGYDGKQLSHCVRLLYFIQDYTNGVSIADCYKVNNDFRKRELLKKLKKQQDEFGNILPVEKAQAMCDETVEKIKSIKEKNLSDAESVDTQILDRLLPHILKRKIREDLLREETID